MNIIYITKIITQKYSKKYNACLKKLKQPLNFLLIHMNLSVIFQVYIVRKHFCTQQLYKFENRWFSSIVQLDIF